MRTPWRFLSDLVTRKPTVDQVDDLQNDASVPEPDGPNGGAPISRADASKVSDEQDVAEVTESPDSADVKSTNESQEQVRPDGDDNYVEKSVVAEGAATEDMVNVGSPQQGVSSAATPESSQETSLDEKDDVRFDQRLRASAGASGSASATLDDSRRLAATRRKQRSEGSASAKGLNQQLSSAVARLPTESDSSTTASSSERRPHGVGSLEDTQPDMARSDYSEAPVGKSASALEEIAELDIEIASLRKQLAQKLVIQNKQLKQLLDRYDKS